MKRLLLLVTLLFATHAFSLDQFSGWCETGNKAVTFQGMTASTLVQQSYPNTGTPATSCQVTAYLHGTLTPATIYSDNSSTPLSNPLTVNTDGSYQFFAKSGRYDIVGKVGSTTIFSVNNVILFDPNVAYGADIGAAINTLCAGGYTYIVIPPGTYTTATQINCDLTTQVNIVGSGGRNPANQGATTIIYTGTASPIVSAQSTYSFNWNGIALVASNASWAGVSMDLSGAQGHDTAYDFITNSAFSSSGGGASSVVVKLDKANSSMVSGNSFNNYGIGIQGIATAGSYSNVNQILSNHFSNSTGTATEAHIKDPYQGWTITGNTFEGGNTNRIQHTLSCTLSGSNGNSTAQGIEFSGNWMGDGGSTSLPAITCGGHYSGNFLSFSSTIFDISAAATNLVVQGNAIYGAGVGYIYNLGASLSTVKIGANTYSNVGTFSTGDPLSGEIITDTGSTLHYNVLQVRGRLDNWNFTDSAANLNLIAGVSADQDFNLNFQDHTLTSKFQLSRLASGTFRFFDVANGNSRLLFPTDGNTYINGLGTGGVTIGGQIGGFNTGTGGGAIKTSAGLPTATWSDAQVFTGTHLSASAGITQGAGWKHQRFTSTTSTAASANATQTTTFNWSSPFVDANYTPVCTPGGAITGTPVWQGVVSYNAAGVTVQVMAATAVASSFGAVYCTAMHD